MDFLGHLLNHTLVIYNMLFANTSCEFLPNRDTYFDMCAIIIVPKYGPYLYVFEVIFKKKSTIKTTDY
jgi:hypothetical protein